MNFSQAISSVFSKYFRSSGRAGRSEYWYFALFVFIMGFFFTFMDAEIRNVPWTVFMDSDAIGISGIFLLATLIPSITVCARRLHDIGRSGWWVLIAFAAFIGSWILLIYWMCKAGDKDTNRFGPVPLTSDRKNTITNT